MTDLDQVAAPDAPSAGRTLDLHWFRRELEQERRFRLDQLTVLAYDALAATDDARSDATTARMRAARSALADVDAAQIRLAIDRFGICQRCGRDISEDRLQAVPTASLCLRCEVSKELANPQLHPWRTGTIPAAPPPPAREIVDVWGEDSFPASDPPANW